MVPMAAAFVLVVGVLGTDPGAAAASAVVAHHATCNNDPGYDPSNEPLCRYQHAQAGHYGYPHHDPDGWWHRHRGSAEDLTASARTV
jgi:hypothetical protein